MFSHLVDRVLSHKRSILAVSSLILAYQPLRSYCNGPMVDPSILSHANLSNQVVVITGVATGGIGYETARVLYEKNGQVVLAVRDVEKGMHTREELMRGTSGSGQIHVMRLDLSDLESVQAFAESFNEKFEKCDILVNNAGISNVPHGLTKQQVGDTVGN